jgi:CyaY protein
MEEQEFTRRAGQVFAQIEAVLEGVEKGLDYERASDGILELDFDDGSQMVIHRHAANREIWVASKNGAFHFRWQGENWQDTRDGTLLWPRLGELVSMQAGVSVCF